MKLLFFLLPFMAFAETNPNWEHQNPGCPLNSICHQTMGKKRLLWKSEFKDFKGNAKEQAKVLENFRLKNGIPFKVWAKSLDAKDLDVIRWDSPCRNHSKNDSKIYLAEVFTKDLKKLNTEKIIEEKAFILNEKDILAYPIPRKEFPIYMSGTDMVFSLYYEGIYFDLLISPEGNLSFPSKVEKHELEDIKCPPELVDHFKKYNKNNFYIGHFCRAIYDTKTKLYRPLLIGLSCP